MPICYILLFYNMTDWFIDTIGWEAFQPVLEFFCIMHDLLCALFSWCPVVVDGIVAAFDILFT